MTQTDYVKKAKPKASTRKPRANAGNKGRANSRGGNSRSGNNSGRSSRSASQQSAQTQKPPFVAIALLITTLGAFGYFLWTISGSAEKTEQNSGLTPPTVAATKPQPQSQSKSQPVQVAAAPKPAKNQEQDFPEPPKEQWQYIDELKRKEVEVEKAKIEQSGPWLIQCATFKDARRAETFKAQLAMLNFESRIKTTQSSNGPRHRVQLGPYETNRDAQTARHQLSRHKINGCKIWLWT